MGHGPKTVLLDRLVVPADSRLRRLPFIGLVVAVIGVAGSFAAMGDGPRFYYSWLVAFLFFLSISLGCLFFVLVLYATKAGWGIVVRRLAEDVMQAMPIFALAVIPVIWGAGEIYHHWTHPAADDALVAGKQPYLNLPFFYVRTAFYLILWVGLALWYGSGSRQQDESGDEAITRRLTFWSGPAILAFALSVTFAAFDWIMSLDPHWYSTIFGVYFFAGCLVSAFAYLIILATRLSGTGPMGDVMTPEHFHDLGKLLFAFVVFWAYIGFSQFFLIWYGNIPEETAWYLHRMEGGWENITLFLAVGHFLVPFFFLMPRTIKRVRPLLFAGAIWMMLMHLVDIYWLVMPTHDHHFHLSVLDFTTFAAVGGLFLAAVSWFVTRRPLVPVKDPRLVESLTFENI